MAQDGAILYYQIVYYYEEVRGPVVQSHLVQRAQFFVSPLIFFVSPCTISARYMEKGES